MVSWIAIEGVIGAGKTTTAKLLGGLLEREVVREHVEEHPLISSLYDDAGQPTMEIELIFTAMRASLARRASVGRSVVSDFAPAKTLIFAGLTLSPEDLAFLHTVDTHLWRSLPRPDVAIFLDVPPDICLERSRQRGRAFETALDIALLRRLRDRYAAERHTLGRQVITLELNGDETPTDVANQVAHAL
jgi:deoxyguanosine kinase